MLVEPKRYHATVQLIEATRLTPTEHLIWKAFLQEAVDPEYAAQYIWKKVCSGPGPPEQALQELKQNWKQVALKLTKRDNVSTELQHLVERRDNGHCFMTRQKPPNLPVNFDHVWVIPPNFFKDNDMDPQGPLYPVLEAFLTPARTSELRTLLQTEILTSQLRNQFLLSPTIHTAFRNGWIQLSPPTNSPDRWNDETELKIKTATKVKYFVSRQTPEPCGGLLLSDGRPWDQQIQMCIMQTEDASLPLPDPSLLRVHYRIASSLHLFRVEERISEGWPSPPLLRVNTGTKKALRWLWQLLPKRLRIQVFRLLVNRSRKLYPRSFTGLVHQLPFGLYAKECHAAPQNEIKALRLVEKYTSIPAPLWIDDYQDTHTTLIMTAMPGKPLEAVFHRLSYPEREQLSKDLKNVRSQLEHIPNKTPYLFGNSHGGPMLDHRFPSGIAGPFQLIQEFNSFLVHSSVGINTRDKISAVHSRDYRSVFTHADLHPSNILIENGRLSGIVDWECAGYYPEYWEFTKLMYGTNNFHPMRPLVRDLVEEKGYCEELEAEKLLWYDTPFGV